MRSLLRDSLHPRQPRRVRFLRNPALFFRLLGATERLRRPPAFRVAARAFLALLGVCSRFLIRFLSRALDWTLDRFLPGFLARLARLGRAAALGLSKWSMAAVTSSIEAIPSTPLSMPLA